MLDQMSDAYDPAVSYNGIDVVYPYQGTEFPVDIVPPTFRWRTETSLDCNAWMLVMGNVGAPAHTKRLRTSEHWTPEVSLWKTLVEEYRGTEIDIRIVGANQARPGRLLAGGSTRIKISHDAVEAPVFYREVNLPFIDAVKDPSKIRWRLGSVGSMHSPVVLTGLPVCGNCHSFSSDGQSFGMDVDYANDKGSYVVSPVSDTIELTKDKIITWSDYKKEDDAPTFGLLSQISPDGKHIISTVKDRSVFVPKPDLSFSQLFFPIKGILAVYSRDSQTYKPLPGADDPKYVQSNPTWSPDGKYVVFARSEAYELQRIRRDAPVLLTEEECSEFLKDGKTFLFDLYRVPFNDGKGGVAEPLKGASHNGLSNFFAKYSPNGKWIVFCKAKSFMLLQPDSELYIIPAEGGTARRLQCNTSRMNSWHTWSPNGKWLLFSSKAHSPYTQLFLTHIDDFGFSTPPIELSHLTAPDRAANIPEFVNTRLGGIKEIREMFVDDFSFMRAGYEFLKAGDYVGAAGAYREALGINPENADAHCSLGFSLFSLGKLQEAQSHFVRAIELDPEFVNAHFNLGQVLASLSMPVMAEKSFRRAMELDETDVDVRNELGRLLLEQERLDEAEECFSETVRIDPNNATALSCFGFCLLRKGDTKRALEACTAAAGLNAEDSHVRLNLAQVLTQLGKTASAIEEFDAAIRLDPGNVTAHLNLAWTLATTPHAGLRDPARGLAHAKAARELLGEQSPVALDTMAACYAEAGRFKDAADTARKALEYVSGQETLESQIRHRLSLYLQNRGLTE